ncbi:MAG TPA: HEPN domain-containing protein [Candidatus Methanoperedens sp.]|nr:HEPN domain-containing protein [Candidatus Methanoperedens sp.]
MDNKEGLKWFEYAENDFEAAKILSLQVKPKLEIVCYHCQQCAEKMLKGYIASKNGKLQKTHVVKPVKITIPILKKSYYIVVI